MREFTREDAQRLIAKMRVFHGKSFSDQWAGIELDDIASAIVECLQGLTAEQLAKGYERLKSSPKCPSIPQFRAWCEPMSDWLSAEEAWAKVQAAGDDRNTVVWNEQEQAAWAACQPLIEIRDMFSAARCFKDAYKRELDTAMVHGKRPVYSVSLGYDQSQRVEVVRDAEKRGLLTNADATKAIGYIEESKAPTPDFVRAKLADIWKQLESGNA